MLGPVCKQVGEMASTLCWNASVYRHARTSNSDREQASKNLINDLRLRQGRYKLGVRVAAVAGVDFGTTHSTISVVLEHAVTAVPVADNGSVLLPSTVCYSSERGTCSRGRAAQHVAKSRCHMLKVPTQPAVQGQSLGF